MRLSRTILPYRVIASLAMSPLVMSCSYRGHWRSHDEAQPLKTAIPLAVCESSSICSFYYVILVFYCRHTASRLPSTTNRPSLSKSTEVNAPSQKTITSPPLRAASPKLKFFQDRREQRPECQGRQGEFEQLSRSST